MPPAQPAATTRPAGAHRRSLLGRLGDFFEIDATWERPTPAVGPADYRLAGIGLVLSLASVEFSRGLGYFDDTDRNRWVVWAVVTIACALLAWRRRYPLVVASLATAHLFVVGIVIPEVMGHVSMQIVYFIAYYSAVAWARDRRALAIVMGAIVVLVFGWLIWSFAIGNAVQQIIGDNAAVHDAWFSRVASGVALTMLINVVYFGGAAVFGQVSWRNARQQARLAEQAHTIAAQAQDLQRRAVLDERLRIARELHDVVAHHVSVIGIQAAAGRRVIDRDLVAAAGALGEIEQSSRDAVTQMRGLLGTLRSVDRSDDDAGPDGTPHRGPEPGVADLPALVTTHDRPPVHAAYEAVEDPSGAVERLPASVGLSLYRTTQEALANVSRHSTATQVRVVLRVREAAAGGYAEVEVIDNGRPRRGTSGSGLGQLGIRERAASHRGGEVDIGPRAGGGYRVRVRLPLGATTDGMP